MRIPERNAVIYEIIRHIGRIREAVLCGCFHHFFIKGNRIDHAGEEGQAHLGRIDRVEHALFVFLHIFIIRKRQALHRRQKAHECAVDTSGLAAHELGDIRVLLLRHDTAAGTVGVVQLDKAVLVGIPDDDLLGETAQVHHDRRQRGQILNHVIAVGDGVHAVARRSCKAEQLCGIFPVERIGRTGQRACAERAVVHSLVNVFQTGTVSAEHFKIGADVMRQCDRLCFLQVGKARHEGIDVLLHDPLQYF